MRYTNIKVPLDVARMATDSDAQKLLMAVVGHGGTIVGPDETDGKALPWIVLPESKCWAEADVIYEYEGTKYLLMYDYFFDIGENIGRIFRYEVEPL